ncbi:MAG: hypothetical protein ACOYON_08570 [Fimbriimonas sp.]
MKIRIVSLVLASFLAVSVAFGQVASSTEELNAALAFLKEQAASVPAVKANEDTIRAVLTRYYLDPDSLKDSEREIVIAFLSDFKLGSRSKGKDAKLAELFGGGDSEGLFGPGETKPAPKPNKKAPSPPPVTPAPKPAPKRSAQPPKLTALKKKPIFIAGARPAPGGKSIGYIDLSVEGRRKTLVEVLSGGSLGVAKRADVIRARFLALNNADPLWWMKLGVGSVKGQSVVTSPRAPGGFIVTADAEFARECGLEPAALARTLVRKIRDGMEETRSSISTRALPSPEEMRGAAISLRQEGDGLFATDKKAAEAKYLAAVSMEGDPTYHVAYLRLADLYLATSRKADAKKVLQDALEVEGLAASAKAELEKKLAGL